MSGFGFINCTFNGCNLGNVTLNKTSLIDVAFTGCKMVGLHFDTCNDFLFTPRFEHCILDYSSFHKRNLKKTVFSQCSMLEVDFEDGEWKNAEIKPYQPLLLEPSLAALHYGQAIFEGVKAYKNENGETHIFRPFDNFKRFNASAERMQMPQVPEELFLEGMRLLIELDKNWIPQQADHSLYIINRNDLINFFDHILVMRSNQFVSHHPSKLCSHCIL